MNWLDMKIAVPIENKIRDLRGFLWLALHLTREGHEVILGETASLRYGLDILEPNVWIRGGLSKSDEKIRLARMLKKEGGSLVIVESEGAHSQDRYITGRVNEQMSEYTDIHCTWGSQQTELLREHLQDYDDVAQTTGNPRFDLTTEQLSHIYNKEAEVYNNTYDRYILVATNFFAINKDDGSIPDVISKNNSESDDVQKIVEYQEVLFSEYIDAIQRLTSDLDYNIVLRPHPREDITTYHKLFSDNDNVYVAREGSVRPYILSADAVIHKSSTTGIESALLRTPVFTYRPIKNRMYDQELPILVSTETNTYSELYRALSEDIEPFTNITPEVKERLQQDIYNLEEPFAAQKITEAINSLDVSNQVSLDEIKPSFEQRLKRIGVRVFGGNIVETVGEVVFGTDRSGVRNKFSGLSIEELNSEIELIDSASSKEFPELEVNKIRSLVNTFSLRPEE